MNSITIIKRYFSLFFTLILTIIFIIFSMIFMDILILEHNSKVNVLIENNLQSKKNKLKNSVEDTIVFLETEYKKLQLKDKKKLDTKLLIAQLKNYRFFNGSEVIIFDDKPKILFTTYLSNVLSNDLFELTDNNKKKFIKELYDKVKNKNEGIFISYSWDRPFKTTTENNKLQYGKYSKLLNLTVTSHQFIDDIQEKINQEEKFLSLLTYKTNIAMVIFFLSVLVIFFAFIFYMIKKLQKNYEDSISHFLDEIKKDAHVIEDDGRLYGFGKVIAYFNKIHNELIESHKEIDQLKYKLKENAITDPLTGFSNRESFYASIKDILDIAKREKTPVSLAVLGISNFETIRKDYGYPIADEVIKNFAKILNVTLRQSDIVSRLTGDRFILFLYNTPYDGSKVLLERLERKMENHRAIIKEYEVEYNIYCSSLEVDFTKDLEIDKIIEKVEDKVNN